MGSEMCIRDSCQSFLASTLAGIEKRRPKLIILATASDGYIEEPSTALGTTPDSVPAHHPAEKARLWSTGLSSVLTRLSASAPVLLVHPIPRFRTWTLDSCAAYKVWFDPLSCAGTTTRIEVDAWRQRAVQSELSAAAPSPRVRTLELADILCPEATCRVLRDGVWIFRDGAHLSVPGSLTLIGVFRTAIEQQVDHY